jgi:endonuclease-3
VTIISQNTNDKNTEKSFERLSNHFRIDPETLAHAQIREIENSLKTAGLYRNKAKAIKQVSKVVVEKYRGNLKSVLSKPLEDARQELMQLPNVGPKTADVVLLFAGVLKGALVIILGIIAIILFVTSVIGFCPLYVIFGISTKKK